MGGRALRLLGPIAKKDMSCLSYHPGASCRQSSHPQLIPDLVNSHVQPKDRRSDPDRDKYSQMLLIFNINQILTRTSTKVNSP